MSVRRRHAVRAAEVVLVLCCAGLPWAWPQLPEMVGAAVPAADERAERPSVTRALVEPPAEYISAPLGSVVAGAAYRPGRPLEVTVPRLHVASAVVPISAENGALTPPADARTIGWWRGGAKPGAENGAAVLTGHTVRAGGGAFDHLGDLLPGDAVSVRTAHGWIHYEVASVRDYAVRAFSRRAPALLAASGAGRLVLVTCANFDGTRYLDNTVVVAVPTVRPA